MFELVNDYNGDLNAQDKDGNTALHLLADAQDYYYMQILVQLGADMNIQNNEGLDPVDFYFYNDKDKYNEVQFFAKYYKNW